MTSHGKNETEKLKENLELQLDRLVTQLSDLESCRDEMDEDEYVETKEDTIEQLKEFNDSLNRLVKGDVTLVSAIGAIQLATQAAISQAFKTPEVIRLFGRQEPQLLREKLSQLDQDYKLGKINSNVADERKVELLLAIRALKGDLTAEELQFLEKHNKTSIALNNIEFVQVNDAE